MINLRHRSYQKELMDADNISLADMAQTLKELNIINTRLGGHAITISGLRALWNTNKPLLLCEIGCGGGDNLAAVYRYCQRHHIPVRFIGIDLNETCISYARHRYTDLPCEWICSDYAQVAFTEQPDIIFTSLFCHHFTDEQLIFMLGWLQRNSRTGFFINDLHRHWLAYYLIKYITRFFSKSYLVKNDACLSVARSFRRHEWIHFFNSANLPSYSIRWRWAFRWLVVSSSKQKKNA